MSEDRKMITGLIARVMQTFTVGRNEEETKGSLK